jgi:glyoxylase I family protein
MTTTSFSHLGICVSDLERSLRFYCDALGFEVAESHDIGNEFAALMELDAVRLRSQFIRRGDIAIELLGFAEPQPTGDGSRRSINALGLTHLSFRVHDLEATATAVETHGGRVVRQTHTAMDFGTTQLEFVYCTDPDGVRIELMDLGS